MKKRIIEEFNVKIQKDRDIGIEIEMEGAGLVKGPEGWTTTTDGSLRGESVEWVLTKPVAENDVPIYLNRLYNHLVKSGSILVPSDRCGVHIHINCQDLTTEQVIKFCLLYLSLEDVLVKWCGEDREGNLFCLRAQDAEFIVKCLIDAKQAGSFKKITNRDIRYASLNITSLAKYGSLEFRALRTPKDFDIIKTWIDLLMDVKKASLKYNSTEEIIEAISLNGGRSFLLSIFGAKANLFRGYPINSMLLDAARRVQDIAYAERFKPKKKEGVENLPLTYWYELRDIITWCRDCKHRLVKYNPYENHNNLTFVDGKTNLMRTINWEKSYFDEDELPIESSITYAHQHNLSYVLQMINELSIVIEDEQPEIPEDFFEEDEDEEP